MGSGGGGGGGGGSSGGSSSGVGGSSGGAKSRVGRDGPLDTVNVALAMLPPHLLCATVVFACGEEVYGRAVPVLVHDAEHERGLGRRCRRRRLSRAVVRRSGGLAEPVQRRAAVLRHAAPAAVMALAERVHGGNVPRLRPLNVSSHSSPAAPSFVPQWQKEPWFPATCIRGTHAV